MYYTHIVLLHFWTSNNACELHVHSLKAPPNLDLSLSGGLITTTSLIAHPVYSKICLKDLEVKIGGGLIAEVGLLLRSRQDKGWAYSRGGPIIEVKIGGGLIAKVGLFSREYRSKT